MEDIIKRMVVEERNSKFCYSHRGNRTPGCRVKDGDVSHYTIWDGLILFSGSLLEKRIFTFLIDDNH